MGELFATGIQVPDVKKGKPRGSDHESFLRMYAKNRRLYATEHSGYEIDFLEGVYSASFVKSIHPLKDLSDTSEIVHGLTYSAQPDIIYNGMVFLKKGQASVNIDTEFNMSPGTFEKMCCRIRRFCINESGWSPVKSSLNGSTLVITAKDRYCSDEVFWQVIAQRRDSVVMNSSLTDDQGNIIREPKQTE